MTTLFLALEFPHDEDFEAATAAAYQPDSSFLKHLELVVQSHYAPAMVNPVRDGVILKVADARIALYAVQVLTGILAGAAGTLEDPPDMDAALQTQDVLTRALSVIASGGDV
jgi:hypothetical protein